MNKLHFELLDKLKHCYIETNGEAPFQVEGTGSGLSARQFYLKSLADNLVRPMDSEHRAQYAQGSGGELEDKMKALRSSSAMTFNILGNARCRIKRPDELFSSECYSVQYEYQLPTLKSGLPANLDALLRGNDGDFIACEMKMLEWLTSKPVQLKNKYLDRSKYIYADSSNVFIGVADKLNQSDVFTHYDYAQMFKHALALYNAMRSGKLESQRMTLLNCVWEPFVSSELKNGNGATAIGEERLGFSDENKDLAKWLLDSRAKERAEFQAFTHMMQPVNDLFEREINASFEVKYVSAMHLIDALAYPCAERVKLDRYFLTFE